MPGYGEHIATLYKCTRSNGYEFPLKDKELNAFYKVNQIMIQHENFVYFINYSLEIIIKCDASSSHVGFCILQVITVRFCPLHRHATARATAKF